MISQEVTQRNVWPYIIGLSLILLAFLVGWMANEILQTNSLPVNIGSAPVVEPSAEIDPADRKFFTGNYTVSGNVAVGSGSAADIDPADRKFYTNDYSTVRNAASGVESLSDVDPADRKFFTNDYSVAGGTTVGIYPLSKVDPADRKFYTQ